MHLFLGFLARKKGLKCQQQDVRQRKQLVSMPRSLQKEVLKCMHTCAQRGRKEKKSLTTTTTTTTTTYIANYELCVPLFSPNTKNEHKEENGDLFESMQKL